MHEPPRTPGFGNAHFFLGLRHQIGGFLDCFWLFAPLLILFLLFGLRLLLRRGWLAFLAVQFLAGILSILFAPAEAALTTIIVQVVFGAIWWSLGVLVPFRFGLLALVCMWFFAFLIGTPGQFGLSGWQAEASWTALLLIAAVAAYGCHTALAGRALFRDDLLAE